MSAARRYAALALGAWALAASTWLFTVVDQAVTDAPADIHLVTAG